MPNHNKRNEQAKESLFRKNEKKSHALTEQELHSDWQQFQSESKLSDKRSEAYFASIMSQIKENKDGRKRNTRHLAIYKWTASAAAIIVLSLTSFWGIQYFVTHRTKTSINDTYVFSAKRGETKKVALPDGSVALLNSDSKLSYQSSFGTGSRTVKLEGEGFFKVTRDSLNPFIVQTNKVSTKVLGTQFNVNAYDFEKDITVSVKKGKVAVSQNNAPGNSVLLMKNQKANFHIASESFQKDTITSQKKAFAWLDGRIIFDNIPLKDAFTLLERYYNITIRCDNPTINQSIIKGSFENQKVYSILEMMSASASFGFSVNGKSRTIIITSKN